jgi:ascorbate PTS system EIIB component
VTETERRCNTLRNLNVICVCGHGLGSSLLLKIALESIFEKLGINANIETKNVGEVSGYMGEFDMLITSEELVKIIDIPGNIPMVTVKNFLDSKEVEEKVREALPNI